MAGDKKRTKKKKGFIKNRWRVYHWFSSKTMSKDNL